MMTIQVLCFGIATTLLVAVISADEIVEETSPMLRDIEEMMDFYKRGWEKVDDEEEESEGDALMDLVDKRGRRRGRKITKCTRRSRGGEVQHCTCNKRHSKKHFLHYISCEGQSTFNGIHLPLKYCC